MMARRSFTTPIGTPGREMVAMTLPLRARSQFICVGAMKNSTCCQSWTHSNRELASSSDRIAPVGAAYRIERGNTASAKSEAGAVRCRRFAGWVGRMRFFLRLFGFVACPAVLAWRAAWAQTGYDRRGGDYYKFIIKSGDPAVCASRCEHDARCRAWSFSYPGTTDTFATCWLKNRVPPRIGDNCCVSGGRGRGGGEPRKGAVEYSIDRT